MEGPKFPSQLAHIWSAFINLNNTRPQGYSGPLAIPYTEIKAWIELTNNTLEAWEVDVLKKLDQIYLKVANG